ncbi:hypothetical protein [Streptomyces sp. NPDC101206]|uniref:hypothetical protein n=1 Tax=Streptomyces sp. NPDC101206 TaxID=3366128 RepID=UPI0037F6E27E
MNTSLVTAAAGVIHAAMQQGKTLPADLAYALESAQLLQSPETAAELARLRRLTAALPANLTDEQVEALAAVGNASWGRVRHAEECGCAGWPAACDQQLGEHEWLTGSTAVGMRAVIGLWERLRPLTNAQPAALTDEQVDALADAGNRALNDHYHEDLCNCLDWPESCASSGNYFAGTWDTAAFDIGMAAVIGAWESMRAPAEAAELARLRARVSELEAERHVTNEALSDAAEQLRQDRDRIAELETDLDARAQDLAAAVAGWGRARDRVAELEALTPARYQTCRECGAGYVYGQPCTNCEFKTRMAAARAATDEPVHEGPERHTYRTPHDLPEYPSV